MSNLSIDNQDYNAQLSSSSVDSSNSESIKGALQTEVHLKDGPMPNVKKMLEDEQFFKSEIAGAIQHHGSISIDLTSDFKDLSAYAKKGLNTLTAINNLLKNRLAFAKQVLQHVNEDLEKLCLHFEMDKNQIDSIVLHSLGADTHNKGKSTLFIEFKMKDGQVVTLAYKPRQVTLEQLVCDRSSGIITSLKKISVVDQLVNVDAMTYPVLAMNKDGYEYGYSLKVEGTVLYDENPTKDGDPSLTTASFMLPSFSMKTDEFNQKVTEIKQEIDKSNDESYKESKRAELNKILEQSFFSQRSNGEILGDYVLFSVLSKLNLSDLHAGNFIRSLLNVLVAIDLECFEEGDAQSILTQITAEIVQRNLILPDELSSLITRHIDEMQLNFDGRRTRVVPISTADLYSTRSTYLISRAQQVAETLADKLELFTLFTDKVQTVQLLKDCFDNFDIPFFEILGDRLLIDGTDVGRLLNEEELIAKQEAVQIPTTASSASSTGSTIIKDDPEENS